MFLYLGMLPSLTTFSFHLVIASSACQASGPCQTGYRLSCSLQITRPDTARSMASNCSRSRWHVVMLLQQAEYDSTSLFMYCW
ncbi:hypothetical protein C8T65DRAFT_677866 [Cerioporus squamosus]|nr:hypothetical protein C8T65DRAFT_677849 [Cerioporus squamosus]KAI0686083.1 hypothetical protein C8T65DRAFT_677866 [Cerioporus squamosus]